jgi:hypothetical protein
VDGARPAGSAIGTVNVPVPLDSTGENDSPIPSIEPSAFGRLIACGVTALLSSPPGRPTGSASVDCRCQLPWVGSSDWAPSPPHASQSPLDVSAAAFDEPRSRRAVPESWTTTPPDRDVPW